MRQRNVRKAIEKVNNHPWVVDSITDDAFPNENPVVLEIGMGKGDFIIGMAKANPDVNYVGLERYQKIIIRALEKLDEELPNLRFICHDAE